MSPNAVTNAAYNVARHTPVGDTLVTALTSSPSVRWFQTHKTYQDPRFLDRKSSTRNGHADCRTRRTSSSLSSSVGSLSISPAKKYVASVRE